MTSVDFAERSSSADGDVRRPVSAVWEQQAPGGGPRLGSIAFDYLVDASGRAGLMSTKYLKNRRYNANLKNVAMWGYWSNAGTYAAGTPSAGAPWFEALTGACGLPPSLLMQS